MFYLINVDAWLNEILERCGQHGLDPQQSIFAIIIFKSLDVELVKLFSKYRNQISSASGENVHLFTPVIYNDKTIPDQNWRALLDRFREGGIPLPRDPSAVLFQLKKRTGAGFEPCYFAAHKIPKNVNRLEFFRDFIDICVDNRHQISAMNCELSELFGSKNLINGPTPSDNLMIQPYWDDVLKTPMAFMSYCRDDMAFVDEMYEGLTSRKVRVWLDSHEIAVGDVIQDRILNGINGSDAIIVVLSTASSRSSWIPFEGSVFYGSKPNMPIIPVIIDDEGLKLANELPFMNDRMHVDLRDKTKMRDGIDKIVSAINNIKK
jgi:hypothetical protein